MTVAGRYFQLGRGRIMALTAAGFPLAEATLPASAGFVLAQNWWGGWRLAWFGAALFLLLAVLPLLLWLARGAQHPAQMGSTDHASAAQSLSRAQVLRDPGFYLVLPATLAAPFSVTAIMFHQSTIAELQGWSLEVIAASMTCFALGHLVSLFIAGPLIDRVGGQRALPLVLLPMWCGMLVLAFSAAAWTPYVYLGLVGSTLGALEQRAERYGRSAMERATLAPFVQWPRRRWCFLLHWLHFWPAISSMPRHQHQPSPLFSVLLFLASPLWDVLLLLWQGIKVCRSKIEPCISQSI